MALTFTEAGSQVLADLNSIVTNTSEVTNRGTLVQVVVKTNLQVPTVDSTGAVTGSKNEETVVGQMTVWCPGTTASEFTSLTYTLLSSQDLGKGQSRQTWAYTITGKGSVVVTLSRVDYRVEQKDKVIFALLDAEWGDGVAISGSDLVSGGSAALPDYGSIWVANNAVATTLSGLNTWAQFTGFTQNGSSRGSTPDHTQDHVTISTTGDYLVTVSAAYSGGATATYEAQVQKNNGATPYGNLITQFTNGASSGVDSINISGVTTLTAADTVELWIRQTSGVLVSPVLLDANLSLIEVS